jgi:hypothetical protein
MQTDSQGNRETTGLYAQIPADIDAAIERKIAGTKRTKREFVIAALQALLLADPERDGEREATITTKG